MGSGHLLWPAQVFSVSCRSQRIFLLQVGSLSLSLLSCSRSLCKTVSKYEILGILSPRSNLSAKLNVPAVMGHYCCPAVAPGKMWPWAMLVLYTTAKANQKRIKRSKGFKQSLCPFRLYKLFSRSDMTKICSVREEEMFQGKSALLKEHQSCINTMLRV